MTSPEAGPDSGPLHIGIDLGGTSIHAAAVRSGRLMAESGMKTPEGADYDEVLDRLVGVVDELRETLAEPDGFAGLCIGAPGAVDSGEGLVLNAPNLGWKNVPLARDLAARVKMPVVVENDVTVGAIGEHTLGAGKGTRHMVALFVGTGVGGALILDGEPFHGSRGAAGEFGHIPAVAGGRLCGCGRRGCFEAYTSRTAMEQVLMERMAEGRSSAVPGLMKAKKKNRMSSSVIKAALDQGDELMTEVMEEAQQHLAALVAGLVNAVDPEMVVFGGGLVQRLGDRFVGPIARRARRGFLQQQGAEDVRIVPGTLGDHAGTLGAAVVAERRLS